MEGFLDVNHFAIHSLVVYKKSERTMARCVLINLLD